MTADGIPCPQRNHTPGAYHLVAVLMDFRRKKSPESEGFINFMNYFINSTFWGSTGKQPQGCKSPVAADEEVRGCCGGDS